MWDCAAIRRWELIVKTSNEPVSLSSYTSDPSVASRPVPSRPLAARRFTPRRRAASCRAVASRRVMHGLESLLLCRSSLFVLIRCWDPSWLCLASPRLASRRVASRRVAASLRRVALRPVPSRRASLRQVVAPRHVALLRRVASRRVASSANTVRKTNQNRSANLPKIDPKIDQNRSQNRPKSTPNRPQEPPGTPQGPQAPPKSAKDHPGRPPGGPQGGPGALLDPPGGAQGPPKGPPEEPKGPQGASRGAPRQPKSSQNRSQERKSANVGPKAPQSQFSGRFFRFRAVFSMLFRPKTTCVFCSTSLRRWRRPRQRRTWPTRVCYGKYQCFLRVSEKASSRAAAEKRREGHQKRLRNASRAELVDAAVSGTIFEPKTSQNRPKIEPDRLLGPLGRPPRPTFGARSRSRGPFERARGDSGRLGRLLGRLGRRLGRLGRPPRSPQGRSGPLLARAGSPLPLTGGCYFGGRYNI